MTGEQGGRRTWATPEQLVEWLELDPKTGIRKLREKRADNTGPHWIKVGREIRYLWSDVHKWCDEQRRASRG
ncbi:MAG: hypothetical protein K0R01_160 [Mycobacterium sp.]|jgi:hypothetical protein|nr:hypothetical protein [Mycobacterium sp.]